MVVTGEQRGSPAEGGAHLYPTGQNPHRRGTSWGKMPMGGKRERAGADARRHAQSVLPARSKARSGGREGLSGAWALWGWDRETREGWSSRQAAVSTCVQWQ